MGNIKKNINSQNAYWIVDDIHKSNKYHMGCTMVMNYVMLAKLFLNKRTLKSKIPYIEKNRILKLNVSAYS